MAAEFLVPYENAIDAIKELWSIRKSFSHLVQTSELRLIQPDNINMSPVNGRKIISFQFTMLRKPKEVFEVVHKL